MSRSDSANEANSSVPAFLARRFSIVVVLLLMAVACVGGYFAALQTVSRVGEVAVSTQTYLKKTTKIDKQKLKDLPNIIFILADDLGYGDLGCYGNKVHQTPNIDRLASEGARFTDFYVTSPVCTPTRIALLTGKHPARFDVDGVLWPSTQGGLPTEEVTMAEWLREYGYVSGIVGKWHVGHDPASLLPPAQGFDSWYGMPYPNDMGPDHPQAKNADGKWPPMPMYRGNEVVEAPIDPNLLTQQYHADAIRFIAENHHRPFFLYLSHAMPHTILGASPEFKGKSQNGLYGDAVQELDWSVGEVMRALRTFGIEKRTLVIFTSDNGAVLPKDPPATDPGWMVAGSNAPFRGGKQFVFEGGVRMPAIFWWPGVIEPGSEINDPAIITDTIPTFAELAGLPPLPSAVDAVSIAPLLRGEKPKTERTLFFGNSSVRAVRRGDWKYLVTSDQAWKQDYRDDPMLFNLAEDPGETKNLIAEHPEIANQLRKAIETYEAEIKSGS